MKKFDDAKEDIGSMTRSSGFSGQLNHLDINIIDTHLQGLQFVVSSALAFDRSELEQKVATINKVSEKVLGAISAVPVPLSTQVADAVVTVGKAARDKALGDMLADVTKGMDAAGEAMSVARIGMLKALYKEQRAINVKYLELSEQYETAVQKWRRSPPEDEVKNYMALRAIEKEFNSARSRLNSFKSKVESVTAGCESAIATSDKIKGQGATTGHRVAEKRMPDQHALTQHMYKAAVIQYMKDKFKEHHTPTYLKREEVKMLEKAFPERFVEERTGVEWHKQGSEIDRAKMKARIWRKERLKQQIKAAGTVKDRVEREEANRTFFKKTPDEIAAKVDEEIDKEVEKEFKRLCLEHSVEREVDRAKVISPLNGERVCQETADRHARLARSVEYTDSVAADTTVKLSRLMVSGSTKHNIGAILQQEEAKLFSDDGYMKLFDADGNSVANTASAADPELEVDVEKAQMLQTFLEEIGPMANATEADKTARFNKIDEFEASFSAKFGVSAESELGHFRSFATLQQEKALYLNNAVEAGLFSKLKVIEGKSYDACDSTAEVDRLKTQLQTQINEIEAENRARGAEASSMIAEKIGSLRTLVETRAEVKLGKFHEQALRAMETVEACRTTDFSACTDAAKVDEIATNVERAIAVEEAKISKFASEDRTALTAKIADIRSVIDAKKQQALERVALDLGQLASKKAEVQGKIATLKANLRAGRESNDFNPDTTAAMEREVASLESRLDALTGTHAQQTAALVSIESRADKCTTLLTTMKSTDYLKYDGVAKLPPVVQEALSRPRTGMSLDERVAEDHFAASVIASYRLNPQIMAGEIAELRAHEHAQTKALVDYHAIHVFDDATQDNVGEKITELRSHLQTEIRRIEKKEPNPKAGSNAAKKLDMLRQEDKRLGALKDMVDNKVCFSAIQFHLQSIVDNVEQAAKIQRNFLHGSKTSTEKNLFGSSQKFAELKEGLHQGLKQKIDAKHGAGVANDADHDEDEDGEHESRGMHA